jgi:hypothetical protein
VYDVPHVRDRPFFDTELEELPKDSNVRVDLDLESDNDNSDDSDSDDNDSDDSSNSSDSSSNDSSSSKNNGEDFLIKESVARDRSDAKSQRKILTDNHDSDPSSKKKKCQEQNEKAPTIQLKISLGDFQDNPVMNLLSGEDHTAKTTTDASPLAAAAEEEDELNGESDDMDEKPTASSNLLVLGKRKRPPEKPRGPLITELS